METKIKWLLWANALLSLLFISIFLYQLNSDKSDIVYVNSNKLLLEYEGMKAVMAEYQSTSKTLELQADTLQQEFNAGLMKFEAEQESLSERENKERREILEAKRDQLMRFQAAIQEKLSKEEQRLQQGVVNEVNGFLKAYGERKGYKMIMAATTMGNIVYAAEGKDITEDVLYELNEQYGMRRNSKE